MTFVNNPNPAAPLTTNAAIDELANQVRGFRRRRALRSAVRANDRFGGVRRAAPNAPFAGMPADPFAQLFNALGFLSRFSQMAGGASANAMQPNAPIGYGPRQGGQGFLPFMNPQTGRLDPMQLANAFQGAGMDPMSSFMMGNVLGASMSPQQFFQPLWNAMGGQGLANLNQLGSAFAPINGRPDLAAGMNAARQAGNVNGVAAPRPRQPVVAPPVAQQPPRFPPIDTPQGINRAGQVNQRRILNRADGIVKELYGKDAVVVDNNAAGIAGKIDARDAVEFTDQNGQRVRRVIGDKQFRELQMRTHTVEGAKILDQAKKAGRGMGFQPDMNNPKVNEQFWNVGPNGQVSLKPGVPPSAAIDDVFANPQNYALDCAAAAHLVGLRAIRQTIGAGDFNRSHANLSLKGWQASRQGQGPAGSINHVTGTPEGRANGAPRPGDLGYIKNPDNISAAWQGENVIYLGNGQYFGHPGGIKSKDDWVGWINQNARKPDATRSAYMTSLNGDWGANTWAQNDFNTADSNAL